MKKGISPTVEVRQVHTQDSESSIYLIAHYQQNKITGHWGYVLYQTNDLKDWNAWNARPLVDTILFTTPREALDLGEQIILAGSSVPA